MNRARASAYGWSSCAFAVAVIALAGPAAFADELQLNRAVRPAFKHAQAFRARGFVHGPQANPESQLESLIKTVQGPNFEDNAFLNSYVDENNDTYSVFFNRPEPHGAVGPNHLVSTINSSIVWWTKEGDVQFAARLGEDGAGLDAGSFFEVLDPIFGTSAARVLYDSYAERFVVVALDWEGVQFGGSSDICNLLLAVSDDSDPNGTWHFHKINASLPLTIDGATNTYFADGPLVGVGAQAIYISCDFFSFNTGAWGGSRLFIVDKDPLYAGGAAVVSIHDPITLSGAGDQTVDDGLVAALQPAEMFGPTVEGIDMYLVGSGWYTADGTDYVLFLEVADPLTVPFFENGAYVSLESNVHNDNFGFYTAPQKDFATNVNAGSLFIQSAAWRGDSLWATMTYIPTSGPDVGQVTAHWIQVTTALDEDYGTVVDQGNVGGEELAPSTHTYFSSIIVDSEGNMALGFSASGPNLYPGAYYTARLATDPPGMTAPAKPLAPGLDYYYRPFGGSSNRWGNYSATVVDPVTDTFWVFNGYASTRGTILDAFPTQDGRWGTRWGAFDIITSPADFDGDGDADSLDFSLFAACVTGAQVPYAADALPDGCTFTANVGGLIPPDLDRDGDVDQGDFAIFQRCYNGSNQEPVAGCTD